MSTDSPINRVEQVQVDDLACWRIHTAHGEALIAQHGAQLLSYQPHEQPPLVWLSDEAGYRRGQSVRGGVPVCWPWFGPLERNPQEVRGQVEDGLKAPAHGLVRASTGKSTTSPRRTATSASASASTPPMASPAGRTRRRCACCSASASA